MVNGKDKTGFENLCEYKNNRVGLDQCFHKKWRDSKYCVFHALCEEGIRVIENSGKRLGTYIDELTSYYCYELEAYQKLIAEYDEKVELDYKGFVFPPNYPVIGDKIYERNVNFAGAKFLGSADFEGKTFKKKANFSWAEFDFGVEFDGAVFEEKPIFIHTIFGTRYHTSTLWASFAAAHFEQGALFWGCEFNAYAYFVDMVTSDKLTFKSVEFRDSATFKRAIFGGNVELIRAVKKLEKTYPGPVFQIKRVLEPAAEVDFREVDFKNGARLFFKGFEDPPPAKIDLGDWAFAGTPEIENATFVDVTWRGDGTPKRNHTYDEKLVTPNHKMGSISHETAAEVYRLLRKNYEKRLAYETASGFHIGQMEMLLADSGFPDSKKFFLRLYRLLSNFGEDPYRPLGWLLVVWYIGFIALTTVTLTNTIPGIEGIINANYVTPWEYAAENLPTTKEGVLITLIETLKYFWGNIWSAFKNFIVFPEREAPAIDFIINTIQKLAGGTLVTFAILALRRAFRR